MKKAIFTLLAFMLVAGAIYAQAPQAVCYQALAKDGNGNDVPNQEIAIRASILKGGPTGQIYWQETHLPTTDDFSIFTVDVGEGQYQGGILTSFDEFDWGDGEYWLRIEMDVNGGLNYALMGATRLLSVPYALYAGKAGSADVADVANTAIQADTANFATIAGSAGQTDTALYAGNAGNAYFSDTALYAGNAGNAYYSDTATVALNTPNDLDQDPENELQSLTFQNDSIILLNADGTANADGSLYFPDFSVTNEIQTLTLDNNVLTLSNGGNSVDFNQSSFGGPGASSDFPQGILGEYVVLATGQYEVPSGKNLYVTAGGNNIKLDDFAAQIVHPTTPNMPILPPESKISDCMCTALLVDTNALIEPVIIDLTNIPAYAVPNEKVLFIKSGLPNDLPGRLVVDGVEIEFFRPNFTRGTRNITIPEGALITKPALYSEMILTGYLIDKGP